MYGLSDDKAFPLAKEFLETLMKKLPTPGSKKVMKCLADIPLVLQLQINFLCFPMAFESHCLMCSSPSHPVQITILCYSTYLDNPVQEAAALTYAHFHQSPFFSPQALNSRAL